MRDYKDFNLAQRLLLSFIQFVEKRLFKRKWTFQEQVTFAKRMAFDDKVWLSEFHRDRTICERYEAMLSDSWHSTPHDSPDRFRDQTLRFITNK